MTAEPSPHPSTAGTSPAPRTAFLVFDSESIPDGRLLAEVKYPGEGLTPEQAVERARTEAREASWSGSDFIAFSFQIPVAVCVIRVAADFTLQAITCLDSPQFRPREVVGQFWYGTERMLKETNGRISFVTFNGRGFDFPLLELAAFRYGLSIQDYYQNYRKRYSGGSIDLQEFVTNFGTVRAFAGGINLLAKLIGKPGKTDVKGDQVYDMYRAGKKQEINDYCLFDTLDTYFVFLRTRILTGDLTRERETELTTRARAFLEGKVEELPALGKYLALWRDWETD